MSKDKPTSLEVKTFATHHVITQPNPLRRVLRRGGMLLTAVHGGKGTQRFTDYKGTPIDVALHYRDADELAGLMERTGFVVERAEVRAPYPFEHPSPRVYVSARAA